MKMKFLLYFLLLSNGLFAQQRKPVQPNKQKLATKENCLIVKSKTTKQNGMETEQKNVLGTALKLASINPLTGFYRTGYCATGPNDVGVHVVAAVVTDEFLKYSLSQGNDLISPTASGFPGLKAGDVWCLCAMRWKEAYDKGVAPPVILEATNIKALAYFALDELKSKEAK
jgi:uncharacterized protein